MRNIREGNIFEEIFVTGQHSWHTCMRSCNFMEDPPCEAAALAKFSGFSCFSKKSSAVPTSIRMEQGGPQYSLTCPPCNQCITISSDFAAANVHQLQDTHNPAQMTEMLHLEGGLCAASKDQALAVEGLASSVASYCFHSSLLSPR